MATLESSHLLDLVFISQPRVAADGSSVAAVVTRIEAPEEGEPSYRSEIRLFGKGGSSHSVGQAAFRDEHPRFSPDGSRLAFLTRSSKDDQAQVAVAPLAGGPAERVTFEAGGVSAFEWQPQGGRIAFLSRHRPTDEEAPVAREVDRLYYKLDGKGYLPVEPRRLRTLELGGEARDLHPSIAGLDIEEFAWAHDGRHIFFTAAGDIAERDEDLRRLWRLEASSGETQELTGPMHLGSPSPAPGGRLLAFLAPDREENVSGPTAVWLLDLESGKLRRVSEGEDLFPLTGGDSRFGEYPNKPLWLSDSELLVNVNRQGRSNLARLNLSGELRLLEEEAMVTTSFHTAAGCIAFTREGPSRPGELFLRDEAGATSRLSEFNEALAQRFDFRDATGPFTPVANSAASYWRIDPASPREDAAVVVQVHGGPHTSVGYGFYFEFQLLVARGYTIVYGNPRGSSSYGFDFATSILAGYGTTDADDVLAFADHALANHSRTDAPVHLTGGSYGGFMTNWLVAHSDRFRSAVTQRSICNFLSFYGTSDIGYHFSERELGGNPWEEFERLWQQSPLRLAHRISTPLLILHSEDDLRCPVEQAQQLFVAIRRNGLAETRLVLFPQENHELSRSGRPDRRIRRLDEIIRWFEAHA